MKSNLILVATGALLASATPVEKRAIVTKYVDAVETPLPVIKVGDKVMPAPPPEIAQEIRDDYDDVAHGRVSQKLHDDILNWFKQVMSQKSDSKPAPAPKPKSSYPAPPQPKKAPTPQPKKAPAPPQDDDDNDDDNDDYKPPQKQPEKKPQQDYPTQGSYEENFVRLHNEKRRLHGAPDLVWDAWLAGQAKNDTGCDMVHHLNHVEGNQYGQNIWTGKGPGFTHESSPQNSVKSWYDEEKLYDYNNGVFSHEAGHFTQLVWASSTKLGCSTILCNENQYSGWQYTVCNYGPPGNYQGRFQQNVKPPSSRK